MTQHIFKLVQEWDKTNALNNNYKIDGLIKNLQLKKNNPFSINRTCFYEQKVETMNDFA